LRADLLLAFFGVFITRLPCGEFGLELGLGLEVVAFAGGGEVVLKSADDKMTDWERPRTIELGAFRCLPPEVDNDRLGDFV
jgi:hypothetical protein